jgi:hypothetical protein
LRSGDSLLVVRSMWLLQRRQRELVHALRRLERDLVRARALLEELRSRY